MKTLQEEIIEALRDAEEILLIDAFNCDQSKIKDIKCVACLNYQDKDLDWL